MKTNFPKKLIICLIKDDLRHFKLTSGLNLLGFKGEHSSLNISRVLFYLMDLNMQDKHLAHIRDEYQDRSYQVTELATNDSESFERLAVDIYNWLLKERKTYRKKLLKST